MKDEAYAERSGLKAKAMDLGAGAMAVLRPALKEAMAWSAYQWTVLALLTATFLLVALSYGGIRAEFAAMKQDNPSVSSPDLAAIRTEFSDMKAGVTQTLADMKASLDQSMTKIGAKLDPSQQAKPPAAAPAPKPSPKPRP
jgi:hypothetical protein